MNNVYLTDSWSSLTGLASVAYGSPDLYNEVADQVRIQSVVGFVDSTPPSEILDQALPLGKLTSALQNEYEKGGDFADYIDSGEGDIETYAKDVLSGVKSSADQSSSYGTTFSTLLAVATGQSGLDVKSLTRSLETVLPDLPLLTKIATNIAPRKLDKVPAGTRISITDNLPMGKDYRGVDISAAYLTPSQYYNEVAYPGINSTFTNLPASAMTSIEQGYAGYGSLEPLAGASALPVSEEDLTDMSNIPRSVFGMGTVDTFRDLTGTGLLSKADQDMYSVDLTELLLEKNGYADYNPQVDSNGDFITPVPPENTPTSYSPSFN